MFQTEPDADTLVLFLSSVVFCWTCRYRALTFFLTFLLYTSFHLSRKPISIVKVICVT